MTYIVVHVRGADEESASVISPQVVINLRAIDGVVSAIVKEVVGVSKVDVADPIPHPVSPLSVGVVTGVSGQAGGHIEEAAVRDGVLVIVAGVEREDLPPQSSGTSRGVPSQSLRVEDSLGKS